MASALSMATGSTLETSVWLLFHEKKLTPSFLQNITQRIESIDKFVLKGVRTADSNEARGLKLGEEMVTERRETERKEDRRVWGMQLQNKCFIYLTE